MKIKQMSLLAVVFVCIAGIVNAAEPTISVERANSILSDCVRGGWFDGAVAAAKLAKRTLTTDELNVIVDLSVQRGELDDALRAAKLVDRALSADELNAIIAVSVQNGKKVVAFQAAKLLGRSLTIDELNAIVDYYISHNWYGSAVDVAAVGASRDRVSILLEHSIRKGEIYNAIPMAKALGRSLTSDELDAMTDYHLVLVRDKQDRDSRYWAISIAQLGASPDRMTAARDACIQERDFRCLTLEPYRSEK